jgi:hypothetical protein
LIDGCNIDCLTTRKHAADYANVNYDYDEEENDVDDDVVVVDDII